MCTQSSRHEQQHPRIHNVYTVINGGCIGGIQYMYMYMCLHNEQDTQKNKATQLNATQILIKTHTGMMEYAHEPVMHNVYVLTYILKLMR